MEFLSGEVSFLSLTREKPLYQFDPEERFLIRRTIFKAYYVMVNTDIQLFICGVVHIRSACLPVRRCFIKNDELPQFPLVGTVNPACDCSRRQYDGGYVVGLKRKTTYASGTVYVVKSMFDFMFVY